MIKESVRKAMRDFKAEGHTREEVALKFGVSTGSVTNICRGISPQKRSPEEISKWTQEQHRKTLAEREEKASALIAELGFEYVGGFTMSDAFVTIRCPRCGRVFQRSMVTIRHGRSIVCPGCVEKAKTDKEEQKRRHAEELRLEKEKREQEKEAARIHPCPVCGEMTSRKKYCSKKCANKVMNTRREIRRRTREESALVDKGITLKRLYERDHGICYLCGESCDWEDKEERNGTIICGDRYPSIEHVVPLSKGGLHSWENVKLAHRICNTRKRNRILTTISLPTTSK